MLSSGLGFVRKLGDTRKNNLNYKNLNSILFEIVLKNLKIKVKKLLKISSVTEFKHNPQPKS